MTEKLVKEYKVSFTITEYKDRIGVQLDTEVNRENFKSMSVAFLGIHSKLTEDLEDIKEFAKEVGDKDHICTEDCTKPNIDVPISHTKH